LKNLIQIVLLGLLLSPLSAAATVTGQVTDQVSGAPLADVRVRIQTTAGEPVLTDNTGQFSITDIPPGGTVITASLSYDPQRSINYITGATFAESGDNVVIALRRLPEEDIEFPYDPGTSFNCASCHNAQHAEWQESTHSNAGLNEWVLDLFSGTGTPGGSAGFVFRDTHDPDNTGFCATCHAPIEDAQNPGGVFLDELELISGLDGVTCVACHQMAHVNDNVSALHHLGNTEYRFPDHNSTQFWVWGPLDDVSFTGMYVSHQPGFSEARFCASCHEYNNPNTGAPGQNTYTEWLASPFAQPGDDFRNCQDCHMPAASEPGPIASIGGQPIRPASQRRSHTFTGATPTTLANAINLDISASQLGAQLEVIAEVTNAGAGHRFPTGISLRNALLVVEVTANGQPLPQSGGDVIPFYGSAQNSNTPDDLAGLPGKGFARVLEGRINGQGPVVRPVLFIDAEGVWADTTIASGATDVSSYHFDLSKIPEDSIIDIQARLLYRRAWRDTVVTKGWTTTPRGGPIEIEVDNAAAEVYFAGIPVEPVLPVPSLNIWASLALILALLVVATGFRRRLISTR
jgi:hypothetical protein